MDCYDRVFVNKLSLTMARQRHPEPVEIADVALEPNAVRKKDRHRNAVYPKMHQECVLQAQDMRFSHFRSPPDLARSTHG
jgi:hypothetical protein